jgi:hypothetical protein
MRRSNSFSLAVITALSLTACEPSVGEAVFDDQTLDAGSDVQGDAIGTVSGRGAGTMTGTWVNIHEQSLCVTFIARPEEALNVTFEVVEMEQTGNRVTETREVCSLDVGPLFGFSNTFPQAAARSVNPIVVEDSFVSGLDIGGSYASGTELQLFGLDMPDGWDYLEGELPTEPDQAGVFDGDGDGNPGITLLVQNSCEMYVIQRSAIRYLGTFTTPNQIDGKSITFQNQNLMGTSEVLCSANREIYPNDRSSRFRMVRADGLGGSLNLDADGDGDVTCDEVVARKNELWEWREPDRSQCTAN